MDIFCVSQPALVGCDDDAQISGEHEEEGGQSVSLTLIGLNAASGSNGVSLPSLAIKFIKSNETYLRAPVDVRRDAHIIGNPQKKSRCDYMA